TTRSSRSSAPRLPATPCRSSATRSSGTSIRCRTRCAATKSGIFRPSWLGFSDHPPESDELVVLAALRGALRHEDVLATLQLGLEVLAAGVDSRLERDRGLARAEYRRRQQHADMVAETAQRKLCDRRRPRQGLDADSRLLRARPVDAAHHAHHPV